MAEQKYFLSGRAKRYFDEMPPCGLFSSKLSALVLNSLL